MRSMWSVVKIRVPLFLVFVLMLFLVQISIGHAETGTVVKVEPAMSSVNAGEAFIINLTVVDVQNLYSVDVTLYWNALVLEVVNVDLRLGVESHPDGVLHEPPSIFVAENTVTQEQGKYHLVATSVAPAPSFNGSGNMARITFNVTSYGASQLHLETQLYDYPPPDREPRISLPIECDTIDGSFAAIPEYPITIILFLFMTSTVPIAIFSRFFRKFRQRQLRQFPNKIY